METKGMLPKNEGVSIMPASTNEDHAPKITPTVEEKFPIEQLYDSRENKSWYLDKDPSNFPSYVDKSGNEIKIGDQLLIDGDICTVLGRDTAPYCKDDIIVDFNGDVANGYLSFTRKGFHTVKAEKIFPNRVSESPRPGTKMIN